MDRKITTKHKQNWQYETDEKEGICIIAKDKMVIKFHFEQENSNAFYDVLEIDAVIDGALKDPVSVEGMVDYLSDTFQGLTITAMGRAASHGWITSKITAG